MEHRRAERGQFRRVRVSYIIRTTGSPVLYLHSAFQVWRLLLAHAKCFNLGLALNRDRMSHDRKGVVFAFRALQFAALS
jgi:hypothetical protein